MQKFRLLPASLVALAAFAPGAHVADAQTVTTTTAATTTSTTTIRSESEYMTRVAPRFDDFSGSTTNLQSLVHGLRTGSTVQLAGEAGTETFVFTPSTRPMGYGDITRTLDLAQRQLAAVRIENPTPQQLNASLNGGTILTAHGPTTMSGVLQLRSRGMGWGKIAQTIGAHPVMAKGPASATANASTRTTAGGASVSHGRGHMSVQAGNSSVVTGADAAASTERRAAR
jgi:hypothetical protein